MPMNSPVRRNPLHILIDQLEYELDVALNCGSVPEQTRDKLATRLRELKIKAGVAPAS